MSIWLTSDLHFGHEKEFLWKPRGFSSWEDHAEQVIERYNSVIKNDDIVYILGDCMLKNDAFGIECLKRLKGHKYLAIGNHDSDSRIDKYRENNIFEDIQYGYRLRIEKSSLWLQHYPSLMGNYRDKHPTFCIAGHTHSPDKFQNMENGCYNIALDAHKCYPVSLDKILIDIREYREVHPTIEPDKSPYCSYCAHQGLCLARNFNRNLDCPGYKSKEGVL